jgi:hypothetical protein
VRLVVVRAAGPAADPVRAVPVPQKNDVDLTGVEHFTFRMKSGEMKAPELALAYPTPEQAVRAEAAVRAGCARGPRKIGASVEGRVVRYVYAAGATGL